ncbi:proton-coupled amino acid transporter 3 [Phymastichus coffea]|uniref:proton-coupled amino acid transporter 3 n=1 Tax=Phymastichus coffea TaxID=108790 RepID=UPI00273B3688|nr:proton-coupled amino acid transporter 3 [Phymastichus coffea]
MSREKIPLLPKENHSGLSLLFATLCIVDIFGVFPVIALPRAIVLCGSLGIPLVLVVFGLQIYTASLLGKSWNIATTIDPHIFRKNRYPLAAVTELTLGRWASKCVTILLDATIFGGGIPNLLVASQNLQLFGLKVSEQQFNLSFCYWLLVVGLLLCPIMWLGSPRDMKWLVTFSTCIVITTAILIWFSIVQDQRDMAYSPITMSPPWERFISGYGMLAFQFDVHPTLMTVQVDMKKHKDINKAVISAFSLSGLLFVITAGLAVWRYGSNTSANIFQAVPSVASTHIAVLLASLQLCLSSAIGHSALFQHLEDQLRVQRSFGWKRCAMRSAVVALAVAVGESVPRFDVVMSLIGGTLTGPLIFVLPPLMYSKAKALRTKGLRRSSAPEFSCRDPDEIKDTHAIFTDSKMRSKLSNETFADSRVHSRSTHYGFRDGREDKDDGYSYIYYGEVDDEDESLGDHEDDFSKRANKVIEMTRSGSLPVMIDASRPSLRRQRLRTVYLDARPRKFFTVSRLVDWFGYSIVIVGILITISSTYINVKNTIRFVKFTPPCIANASADISGLF